MILSSFYYNLLGRKGLLFFHQKTENVSSLSLSYKISSIFQASYADVLKDTESTRVPIAGDMNESELQFLENAKSRTLKSLPQNSTYWNSDLYHLHICQDYVFIKIPFWFKLLRMRHEKLEEIELDNSWTKLERNKFDSFIIEPKSNTENSKRHLGALELKNGLNFKIANFCSKPQLQLPPCLSIDSSLESDLK